MERISWSEFVRNLALYDSIYLYGSFALIMLFSIYLFKKREWEYIDSKYRFATLTVILLIVFFGTFPYEYAADRLRYVRELTNLTTTYKGDPVWWFYTMVCGKFLSGYAWLILTAAIYVLGFYYYSKEKHEGLACVMMMGFLGFLFFKAYAVNTMRAGIASAIIFYALTLYEKNLKVFLLLLFVAINTHFSVTLTVAALLLSRYYQNTRIYFFFWVLCVPISYFSGTYFQQLFEPFLADYSEKATGYLIQADQRYKSGFRWDFVFYSVMPVVMGYYYIFKKQIEDTFYLNIFNSYLIANAFWILVIRANFSDRMAYLSWMFVPILLLYPVLKYEVWERQNVKIACILIAQELFTFALAIR